MTWIYIRFDGKLKAKNHIWKIRADDGIIIKYE